MLGCLDLCSTNDFKRQDYFPLKLFTSGDLAILNKANYDFTYFYSHIN